MHLSQPKAQVHYCDHALPVVRPSLTFHFFDFSSEIAERISTKLVSKQNFYVFYQVCVLRAYQETKMAALASNWLIHFLLLIWISWMQFNETWQNASFQRHLPSLCFFGLIGNQDGRRLAEAFSNSPLKPLTRIQRNLIRSKISTSSSKFVS